MNAVEEERTQCAAVKKVGGGVILGNMLAE